MQSILQEHECIDSKHWVAGVGIEPLTLEGFSFDGQVMAQLPVPDAAAEKPLLTSSSSARTCWDKIQL